MKEGRRSAASIQLLHVEDDPAFADLTGTYLDRIDPTIDHESVRTVDAARERLRSDHFDAVVCDYDLPDGTGIDLLEHVRGVDPELPFVLFTGKGSEEVAGDAISAGVTDYLQKSGGTEQYEVLINRLHNAVDRYRLGQQVERSIAALEAANEPISILDADGHYLFVNEAYASVYGHTPDAVVGRHWERFYPADEVERFTEEIFPVLKETGHWTGPATIDVAGVGRVREQLVLTHTTDGGHVCIIRDSEALDEDADVDDDQSVDNS